MASLKDISAVCKVSVPTVSKALHGACDVSEKTRRKVLKAAKELRYPVGGLGEELRDPGGGEEKTGNLGILLPDQMGSDEMHTVTDIMAGFREASMRAGYDLTVLNTDGSARNQLTYYSRCLYRHLDGVCVFRRRSGRYDPQLLELICSGLPVVTVGQVFDGHTAVLPDAANDMRLLLWYLARQGHGDIAFIGTGAWEREARNMALFRRASLFLGLELHEEWIRSAAADRGDAGADKEVEGLIAEMRALLRELTQFSRPPRCFVVSGDRGAMAFGEAARREGLRIPEDIPAAVFEGGGICSAMRGALTSVCVDCGAIGRAAAEGLIASILQPDLSVGEQILVPGILLKGESSERRTADSPPQKAAEDGNPEENAYKNAGPERT